MENPDLRTSMGMKADQKGVRIRRIEPTAPDSHLLQPSDVILSFDGVNIANDGTGKLLYLYSLKFLLLFVSNFYIHVLKKRRKSSAFSFGTMVL